jgi:glycosyltransferase involved in cell wall biosynthesis
LKILIVTTRIPYPPFKGDKLKIYNIVKHLAKRNSVKVLCLAKNSSELKYIDGIRSLGAEIEAVRLSTLHSLLNVGLNVFSNKPNQVSLFKSRRLGKRLAEIVNEDSPDVVYFHFIRSVQYVEDMPRSAAFKVLDFTDAVSLYLSRFVETEKNPFIRLLVRNEKNRIEEYEHIAEKFDACFICSPLDRDYLINRGIKADFRILPNGVDTDMFRKSNEALDENRIIFTGNMPYFPNEDAVVHFTKVIMPKILEKVPSAEFYVVGGSPTRKIRRLASSNVIITGFVENISAEYQKSAVAIAPMRFGAGTLNKVIEPIVLGVPVVATAIAVRGLPDAAQKIIQIADNPDEFASAVINILTHKSARKSYKELEGIRESLSWEKIVGDFEGDLRTLSRPKEIASQNGFSDTVNSHPNKHISRAKTIK